MSRQELISPVDDVSVRKGTKIIISWWLHENFTPLDLIGVSSKRGFKRYVNIDDLPENLRNQILNHLDDRCMYNKNG